MKKFYLLVDTETSLKGHVVDFAALVIDKQGKIYAECKILVSDYFGIETLFYCQDTGIFGKNNLNKRMQAYEKMLINGDRILRSVKAVNAWLGKVIQAYNPVLVAYNSTFDIKACIKSGIKKLPADNICLWKECTQIFSQRKSYTIFCLENKCMTPALNLSTSAETMFKYLSNDTDYIEPHTAFEDLISCELFIFTYLLRQKKPFKSITYNWRKHKLIDRIEVT